MPWSTKDMDTQLSRQSVWLRESWIWLLEQRVLRNWNGRGRPTALDVGCGPGFVMELLAHMFDVQGIDIDPVAVAEGRRRGFEIREADAHSLPFKDNSFDMIYCSFLLLWVDDPAKVLSEMTRVSRQWVVCLAEPDLGARIDFPEELLSLGRIAEEGVRGEGGDPLVGRKLRSIFQACGLEPEVGVHPGVWGIDKLREGTFEAWIDLAPVLTEWESGAFEKSAEAEAIAAEAIADGDTDGAVSALMGSDTALGLEAYEFILELSS
ncbi:MAG: class I SAM-dependent methyltransferase [Candidatus Thermoplasmatota archaeon]|nr:class I SAM-dependent methyltransferase [Candidatus Thermoplasmatota archaeon]